MTNLEKYLGKDEIDRATLGGHLQGWADEFDGQSPGRGQDYAASVLQLTKDLRASKGKKLSDNRIGQLLDWHHARFAQSAAAEEMRKTEARAGLMLKVGMAGSAFMAFVLVIFVFLFVKIERNLRAIPDVLQRREPDSDAA